MARRGRTRPTGARRGELCALRWHHLDLTAGVLTLRHSAYLDEHGELREKDTKTHQQRRVALDPETIEVLRELHGRYVDRLAQLDAQANPADYVFSPEPDNSRGYRPDTVTQRYSRLATRLSIDSHIHTLRHYAATELIAAGVDVRAVAGRLGHCGGGTTTLRVYAAWLSESDQRAAGTLAARMPPRPVVTTRPNVESSPYRFIAAEFREQIAAKSIQPGERLPAVAELAARHSVSVSTAHRALTLLNAEGLIHVVLGRRATVADRSNQPSTTGAIPPTSASQTGPRPGD